MSVDGCGLNVTCDGVENCNGGWGGDGQTEGVSSSGCFAAPIPKKSFKFKAKTQ